MDCGFHGRRGETSGGYPTEVLQQQPVIHDVTDHWRHLSLMQMALAQYTLYEEAVRFHAVHVLYIAELYFLYNKMLHPLAMILVLYRFPFYRLAYSRDLKPKVGHKSIAHLWPK